MSALAQNKFVLLTFVMRKKFTLKFLRPTSMYLADFMFHIVSTCKVEKNCNKSRLKMSNNFFENKYFNILKQDFLLVKQEANSN
jgi:hypothetical protein